MKTSNMPSQRQMRFSEVIRSIISEAFLKGDFYNLEFDISSITVSFVKMSKDLKIASVYVMPLGGKNQDFFLSIFFSIFEGCPLKFQIMTLTFFKRSMFLISTGAPS